ncbi:type 2 lantipeptide synthetase LanM [Alteromonadaceae bacterium M269]|nr:type 2 lantipeptide synthetase LanM [Alteromonadaceae bacterium M269]
MKVSNDINLQKPLCSFINKEYDLKALSTSELSNPIEFTEKASSFFQKEFDVDTSLFNKIYQKIKYENDKPLFKNEYFLSSLAEFEDGSSYLSGCFLSAVMTNEVETHVLEMTSKYRNLLTKEFYSKELRKILVNSVESIVSKTLINELNLAYSNDFLPEGLSHHSEYLFAYKDLILDKEYWDYLNAKYKLLLPRSRKKVHQIVEVMSKLLYRLNTDLTDIAQMLGKSTESIGTIKAIEKSLGDSHCGGDSVSIIEFSNNSKVIYKPRSVSVERAFQNFITWFNQSSSIEQKTFAVIEKQDYGWCEYVYAATMTEEKDVKNYFNRYGSMVALIEILKGTDIHFENLIASGAYPIVIDLETLCQPIEYSSNENERRKYVSNAEYYHNSVYYTAMIDPIFVNRNLNGSPLAKGLRRGLSNIVVEEEGELKFVSRDVKDLTNHLPSLNGEMIDCYEYGEEICKGYRETAELILKDKRAFYNKFITCFSNVKLRVVVRQTNKYAKVLEAINSPYGIESYKNTDEYLLKTTILGHENNAFSKVVNSELEDLYDNDIPYFSTKINSIDLVNGRGKVIKNIFAVSGMQETLNSILRYNENKLESSLKIIRNSISHKSDESEDKPSKVKFELSEIGIKGDYEKIFSHILERFKKISGKYTFIDIVIKNDLSYENAPLSNNFYEGKAGVAFALAYYHKLKQDDFTGHLAKSFLDEIIAELDFRESTNLGLCNGVAGYIYVVTHFYRVFGDSYYLDVARFITDEVASIISRDRKYDLFSGTSGLLLALVRLYNVCEDKGIYNCIEQCVNHLILQMELDVDDGAVSWRSPIPSKCPTTGFVHGVPGIGYSLLLANKVLFRQDVTDAIKGINIFLKKHFSVEEKCWHEEQGEQSLFNAWCHGAHGILFYLSEVKRTGKYDEMEGLFQATVDLAIDGIDFDNHSLCHGSMGNIDSLAYAQELMAVEQKELLEDKASEIVSNLKENQVVCGNPSKHNSYSLYTGITGVAYQLMAYEDKNLKLPSVLGFE